MKLKSLIILPVLSLPSGSDGASFLTEGHIDGPAFGYLTGIGFEPHFHNEGGADGSVIDGIRQTTESEYEPDDLVVLVPEASTTTVASATYYWLPESELDAAANGTPFLGIGLEELDPGDWTGGTVTITLSQISGPGEFLLWQDNGFGGINVFIDTVGDSFTLAAGSHTHFNWGFESEGVYELEFTITGIHVTEGLQSGSGTYTFQIPEPSSALMAMAGLSGCFRRRR